MFMINVSHKNQVPVVWVAVIAGSKKVVAQMHRIVCPL